MKYSHAKGVLFVSLLILLFKIFLVRESYLTPYNYDFYSQLYERSQYALNQHATEILSDEYLYSYAGYYYITGGEITRVNFENPPLGKYLIGISILIFRNQNVIYIAYAVLFLWCTYLIGRRVFKNELIAAGGVFLLTIDPYFTRMMSYPMLDLPMALFFIIGIYFYLLGEKWRNYLLASFFWGVSLATKFFPSLVLLLLFLLIFEFVYRRKTFGYFCVSLFLIPLVYGASYFELLRRVSPLEFLKFQWWMLNWRSQNPIVIGNGLESIFLGRYRTWWNIEKARYHYYTADWNALIPLMVSISLYSILLFRKNKFFIALYGLVFVFLLYMNLLTEGGLKYLITIYPFLSLFTSAALVSVLSKKWTESF